MELKIFNQSFDPTRATLAKIDSLVREAGEHFNEAQVDKAKELTDEFWKNASMANSAALDSLSTIEDEEVAQEAEENSAEEPVELKEGQVFIVRDGKPFPLSVFALASSGGSSPTDAPKIVAQRDQITGGHDDDITRKAAASIEAGFDKANVHTGTGITAAVVAAKPGAQTVEIGEREKEGAGDAVGLASTEGDLSTHHTGDGSREILPVEGTEGLKSLVTDKGALIQDDEAHKRTGSLDADRPGDEAAIEAGAQETRKPVVIVSEPGDAGNLVEHPLKSSGIDGDAGDWTTWGRNAEGFPVVKGSPEDVS